MVAHIACFHHVALLGVLQLLCFGCWLHLSPNYRVKGVVMEHKLLAAASLVNKWWQDNAG